MPLGAGIGEILVDDLGMPFDGREEVLKEDVVVVLLPFIIPLRSTAPASGLAVSLHRSLSIWV